MTTQNKFLDADTLQLLLELILVNKQTLFIRMKRPHAVIIILLSSPSMRIVIPTATIRPLAWSTVQRLHSWIYWIHFRHVGKDRKKLIVNFCLDRFFNAVSWPMVFLHHLKSSKMESTDSIFFPLYCSQADLIQSKACWWILLDTWNSCCFWIVPIRPIQACSMIRRTCSTIIRGRQRQRKNIRFVYFNHLFLDAMSSHNVHIALVCSFRG